MGHSFGINPLATIIMSVAASLALCLLATSVSAEVTCDDCRGFGTALQGYLMSSASVAEQTDLLATIACPSTDDPERCTELVNNYWGSIASLMYPEFLKPTEVCQKIGACTFKALLGVPTCDECKDTFTKVSEVIASFEQVKEIIDFLTVKFCPTTSDNSECVAMVEKLMPAAMPILASILSERSAELCCKLSTNGI